VTDHAADRPYRLIVTDDPCRTLAQGEARYFASMIDAANAFAKATEPYKTVIYEESPLGSPHTRRGIAGEGGMT
jgi:hypothetical protein